MPKVKTGPKVLFAILCIGGAIYGAHRYATAHGTVKASSVPQAGGQLATFNEAAPVVAPSAPSLPSETPVMPDGTTPSVRMLILPWNAQMGLALANGGPRTTDGSLMQKYGVNLILERQDDYSKMQEALVACANELAAPPSPVLLVGGGDTSSCSNGANFVAIMGDGGPAFLDGIEPVLAKLGSGFKAEIIGSSGRSYGEDKFMAPPAVARDPQSARGLVVAGVLKDGDWNIAMYFAEENALCNNPDVTTYDPNCLNWVGTSSFVEAGEKYIQGYCEDRPVVANGHKTGETKNVCVNAVVTWTPGDVSVAMKKGGLVKILSTRENSSQMPQAIIGLKGWDAAHSSLVTSMLRATFEAGDQIKLGGEPVLLRAAAASAAIYQEEDAAYWAKYYRGVEEKDAQGNAIPLGGSRVFNLADNLAFFGITAGSANAFAATYTTFGDIDVQQYPGDMSSYPAVTDVVDTSYLEAVRNLPLMVSGAADTTTFTGSPSTAPTIAKKSWHIQFATGSSTFSPAATPDLDNLLTQLVVAGDTVVEIHGHTDNVGDPAANLQLSEDRAFAVKQYLESKAPANFPDGRLQVFAHGQTQPIASNATPEGQAQNRRVDIVLRENVD